MDYPKLVTADAAERAPSNWWPIPLGLGLLSAVFLYDVVLADRGLATEQPPILSTVYAIRSVALLLASIALVVGLRRLTGLLPEQSVAPDLPASVLAAVGGLLIAFGAAVLLLVDPQELSRLVREDHIVEWLSALLAFAAAVLYGVAATRCRSSRVSLSLFAALGTICLLLGLEEISWFQRVFEIESPEFMLNRNGQQELNLHNLATNLTGNVYYVGAFCWCVLLPGLLGDRVLPPSLHPLRPVLPSRLVLFGSAAAAAVVYEMWNIMWIQLTFWMTLVLLVLAGVTTQRRRLPLLIAAATTIVAVVFLTKGSVMIRNWDDTEVRELIIPYGLTLAGLDAARRSGRIERLRCPTSEARTQTVRWPRCRPGREVRDGTRYADSQ